MAAGWVLRFTEHQRWERKQVQEPEKIKVFEQVVMPHLSAAYNLARWLTKNDHDAEDVMQEAFLRAFKFFGGYRGGESRAWLLSIVRHTGYTWLRRNRANELTTVLDEETDHPAAGGPNPEALLLQRANQQTLKTAMEELPVEFREALILRELEGLAYKEIAEIAGVPIGTVMSRLARARRRLQQILSGQLNKED